MYEISDWATEEGQEEKICAWEKKKMHLFLFFFFPSIDTQQQPCTSCQGMTITFTDGP